MKDYKKPYAKYVELVTETVSTDIEDDQDVVSNPFNNEEDFT